MASREVRKFFEEINKGSNDTISSSGSSSEPKAKDARNNRRFTKSCPSVLEHSKDESRHFDGISKSEFFTRSCPQPSATDAPTSSSSSESNGREDEQQRSEHQNIGEQQTSESNWTNCFASVVNCYNTCARTVRDSWFIFVFQLFISVLCVSAIVMGIIFFKSCEGRYPFADPLLIIFIGISGLFLVYKWVSKVCRQRRGEHYWNHEKNRLIMYLMAVLFFMSLEFIFFTGMSPKSLQFQREVKCIKIFYDYLYYLHIANAGCVGLAALLYLPDCCLYVYAYRQLVPFHHNGHYQPL